MTVLIGAILAWLAAYALLITATCRYISSANSAYARVMLENGASDRRR